MTTRFLVADALDVVRTLPDASVDLVATSPPFLALRDYGGIPGQWGAESSPAAFLDHLLELVSELRRVLTAHGSIAIELGDTFSGSGGAGGDYGKNGLRAGQRDFTGSAGRDREQQPRQWSGGFGWPLAKSLCFTPSLFGASLAYGRNLLNPEHTLDPWIVRNVIAWARNNPTVGALADKVRPATSYITVACTSPRRWFDLDAVRTEPAAHTMRYPRNAEHYSNGSNGGNPAGAPPLDHWHDEIDGDLLWLINTQSSSLAHYAMWPPKLAERLVLAMCPLEVCTECREPRRRITGPTEYAYRKTGGPARTLHMSDGHRPADGVNQWGRVGRDSSVVRSAPTLGWSDCGCGAGWRPGVVLDPFAGTGTTLAVAEVHGRDGIGIDLDPANEALLGRRREQVWRALVDEVPGQQSLLTADQMSFGVGQ